MMNTSMVQAQVTEWGCPQSVRVAQIPVPSSNMGHVLVQVEAAGVNPIDVSPHRVLAPVW